jgi:mannose-6-phosphate isomerase-like protein (cupin superfamily)
MTKQLPPPRVLLRSEQSANRVSVSESTMPAGAPGPPLHTHLFDEAFYVLEGELTVQVADELTDLGAGELGFARGGIPHTLANRGETPTRFLIICTPAGFEREFARRAAAQTGIEAPAWARQEIPKVVIVGPRIGENTLTTDAPTPEARLQPRQLHAEWSE